MNVKYPPRKDFSDEMCLRTYKKPCKGWGNPITRNKKLGALRVLHAQLSALRVYTIGALKAKTERNKDSARSQPFIINEPFNC